MKDAPNRSGRDRKTYTKGKTFEPSKEEEESVRLLQEALTKGDMLYHYDPARQLYIDLDGSKKYGFGVHVYHVIGDPKDDNIPQKNMQTTLFLSKLLNVAEKKYWPTELEVAALIWTLKKVRHLLDHNTDKPVIIYTDHSATTDIARQTTLTGPSLPHISKQV